MVRTTVIIIAMPLLSAYSFLFAGIVVKGISYTDKIYTINSSIAKITIITLAIPPQKRS